MKRWFPLLIGLMLLVPVASAQDAPAISPELDTQMDALVEATTIIRGLDTLETVERAFPTRADVIAYLTELYDTELPQEEIERVSLLYVALGLLPADIDLREVYLNLLGSQVAGFYDTDTRLMNVIPTIGDDPGGSLSLMEQIIFIHEYTHALQDQHFGLDSLLEVEEVASEPDRSLAVLSLVEGDASAVMNVYSQQVALQNPNAGLSLLVEGLQAGNLFLPPDVPPVLVRELTFPYDAGMFFVLNLYQEGGWEAVNAAYANPPTTSEQIIHPEKYLAGEGALAVDYPDLAAALPEGWEAAWDITLGEFYLREYLLEGLRSRAAGRAAAGWGGDRFQLYRDPAGDAWAWTLRVEWDTPEDAAEFSELLPEFAAERYASQPADNCWADDLTTLCVAAAGETGHTLATAPSVEMAAALLALGE